ncbi:response regulator [Comamonas endophytica]|uniref:Response regulator n=1 Tax=Comamonas endophytica TaxID=2949090 RepID=A0ABY6GAE2_9BURK|nr:MULTISPECIES: response regulator [unclassified Acidovorax]MCD2511745.1 response regulator [Acidovorax sp. D4N7]UYG51469.1 response regulator [Acidovorax sp. 5MLIR]
MKLVLVVEDEYGNAEILQLLLEAEGYRVAVASNGQHALQILMEGEKPALILSDFMMPIMNGGEFGQALSQDEALRDIPFVFMSATSQDVVRRVFKGYDAFLVKPIEFESLLLVVERLIARGRQPAAGQVEDSMRQLLKGIHMPTRD